MKTPHFCAGSKVVLRLLAACALLSLSACATRVDWTPQPDPSALSWKVEPGFNAWTDTLKPMSQAMLTAPLPLPERLSLPDGKRLLPTWAVAEAGQTIKATAKRTLTRRSSKQEDAPSGTGYSQCGMASWYGPDFAGKLTANGEIYDPGSFTAAHQSLPFNSVVEVKNLSNGRTVPVRINNRGPFVDGRVIDLSVAAAKALGSYDRGVARVEIRRVK